MAAGKFFLKLLRQLPAYSSCSNDIRMKLNSADKRIGIAVKYCDNMQVTLNRME